MICKNCQNENAETHKFCGQCGAPLGDLHNINLAPAEHTPQNYRQTLDDAINEIKKEAHFVESKTLDEIHDRAIRWAKIQMFFLGTAISISLMALLIWGYKQFSDFEQLIENSQNEIAILKNAVSDKAEKVSQDSDAVSRKATEFNQTINKEFERLKNLHTQIDNIDITGIHTIIQSQQNELKQSINEAKRLQEQAKADRSEIQKVQNSFYEVFLQIDDSLSDESHNQTNLFRTLNQNGFLIKERNIIAHISVNKPEVIYYNVTAQAKAQLLVQLLQKDFPSIQLRNLDRKERDPREILVKLR